MGQKEKVLVLASGTKNGGGSGFEKLYKYTRTWGAGYVITAVASNNKCGGVRERAKKFDVPFIHFPAPWDAPAYRAALKESGATWVVCSGWLKFIVGLDPTRTINIHPALLSFGKRRFGGPGLYGHYVHEKVARALRRGTLGPEPRSGFTMHFVVDGGGNKKKGYDRGPIFAEMSFRLQAGMTADQIAAAVNKLEHRWQPLLTDMVVTGKIRLEDGRVVVPLGYDLLPRK